MGARAAHRRPAWRRAAGAARAGACRLFSPVEHVIRWKSRGWLPPAHLRLYYYRTLRVAAFQRACDDARAELVSRGLRPEHRVLDVGSGIGNLATGLLGYLQGGYDGLEIHPEAVAWCQQTITRRNPSFRFHRADITSRAYNPDGAFDADAYRFPFPDRAFDFIFLGSVFTHMLPDGVEQYVREISRVLEPGGVCVASYFLLTDESRLGIDRGESFLGFPVNDAAGRYRLHDPEVPEAAVALERSFVWTLHEQAGLQIRSVRQGGWWKGTRHDQDVVTATRHDDVHTQI
jgi:SAM-dependent methyltransferase